MRLIRGALRVWRAILGQPSGESPENVLNLRRAAAVTSRQNPLANVPLVASGRISVPRLAGLRNVTSVRR